MGESLTEAQALCVTPPEPGTTVGAGITCIATDTTSRTYDLAGANLDSAPGLYGRYVDFRADGGKIYIALDNDSTGAIDETVQGTAGVATAPADGTTEAVPWPLTDGETLSVQMNPTLHRYLHVKGASGTARLRIRPSSPKVSL